MLITPAHSPIKLMPDQEAIRQTILQQADTLASKRRFGLFSQPISTAVADNGPYKTKLHPRDPETKKPVTELRNFYTSPNKKGQRKSDLFGSINSLATSEVKDEFMEPGRRLQKEEKEKFSGGKSHEVSFFTGTGNKILNKSSYEYVEQKNPEQDSKRYRDESGNVKSMNRNFYTNPSSTVENNYFKQYKHMDDPYDRSQQKKLEAAKRNRSLEQEAQFRPNSFVPQLLNSEKKVRELEVDIKKKEAKGPKLNIQEHENPWKSSSPAKKGIYGSLQPFPAHMGNPPPEAPKRRTGDGEQKKDAFKLMSPRSFATPSISISLHRSNILRGKQ